MDPKNKVSWCVTLFPTYGLAQEAELSLQEFEDFVYSVLLVDKKDPIREWQKLSERQQGLVDIHTAGKSVRILGE